jgi:hypothetical protein
VIGLRGDWSLAQPELYEFCEAAGLLYAFGYPGNPALHRQTEHAVHDLETYFAVYGHREAHVQRFEAIADYQADGWSRPRRIIAEQGSQRRYVVTNLSGQPRGIYHGFSVQRGAVPEQPFAELKHGLHADRLSASGFRANAFRLLVHVVAYAIVVLFREAAASVAEVATATVSSVRQRLWKVGAWVHHSVRRIWFHLSETWPCQGLWQQVQEALRRIVNELRVAPRCPGRTPM